MRGTIRVYAGDQLLTVFRFTSLWAYNKSAAYVNENYAEHRLEVTFESVSE